MSAFRVTVCQLPDSAAAIDQAWQGLVEHHRRHPADLVVLNEVPFDAWFGTTPRFDAAVWDRAVARHEEHAERLDALTGAAVLATAPHVDGGRRFNRAFLKQPGMPPQWWRRKTWIPDEGPVWEASWYAAAPDAPDVRLVGDCRLGVLICTELWAMDWARDLGRLGAHLIATPRATAASSRENWLAAGRVAAITSGCFSVSSNRAGAGFGGSGWVISPDGDLLASTDDDEPFVTVTLELGDAEEAKSTYPRYALWTERWGSAADPLPS